MRVLHLTDRWSERGGAHFHLMTVVEALVERGLEVAVAAGRIEAPPVPGCRLQRVAALATRDVEPVDLSSLLDTADLVHVHTVMNPLAIEAAVDRPALVTVQDHRVFCPGQGRLRYDGTACTVPPSLPACSECLGDAGYARSMWNLTQRRWEAILKAQRIIVLSRYMARELVAHGAIPSQVTVVAPFPHALDRRAQASGPPCLLFVGRLTRAKGVWDAVDAWRLAGAELPLVFAGTGPERAALQRAGFEVLGWLDRETLSRVYRRARALLMPPRWQEPYGIVGIEALHMGIPVLAWRSGGIEDWAGSLDVEWGDVDGLAAKIRELGSRSQDQGELPGRPPAREPQMDRLVAEYASLLQSPQQARQTVPTSDPATAQVGLRRGPVSKDQD